MTKEELLGITVSWVANPKSKVVRHQTLREALLAIWRGTQRADIVRMRAVVETDHDQYEAVKATLPANIFAGKFVGGHAASNCVDYNRLLTLDIDKLDAEQLAAVGGQLEADAYVFAHWLSPSGKGYKGLVLLDYGDIVLEDKEYWHREAFNQLHRYFKERYGFELDQKCKDVPRLCFVSYDPQIKVKQEVTVFEVEPIEEVKEAKKESEKHRAASFNYKSNGSYHRNEPGRNRQKDRNTIGSIIKYLEKRKLSITYSYYEWFSVAMAIVTTFNYDIGEKYFLRLSSLDGPPRYNREACIALLQYCYEHSNHKITLGTLIYFAQCKGYKMAHKAVPIEDTKSDA